MLRFLLQAGSIPRLWCLPQPWMGWEPPGVALWGRDRDKLPQEPATTSGMDGTEVAAC